MRHAHVGLVYQFLEPYPFKNPNYRPTNVIYSIILKDVNGDFLSAFGGYQDCYTYLSKENLRKNENEQILYPWAIEE